MNGVPNTEVVLVEETTTFQAGERAGTIIERKRTELGLSQAQVAESLPIREPVFRRIESGLNDKPPDDIIEAIADALSLNADELSEAFQKDFDNPVEGFFFI